VGVYSIFGSLSHIREFVPYCGTGIADIRYADTKTKTYKGKKKSKAVASRVEETEFDSLREVR
jgi:hypothetical protein